MYIIHQPLILALVRASYAPWRIPTQPGHSVLHAQLGYFLFITVLTLAIARITWLVIEQPCLELKRYFPYRWPMSEGGARGAATGSAVEANAWAGGPGV
jgi:peptidoglycan/LPS O-acetylase OafA/YrhL